MSCYKTKYLYICSVQNRNTLLELGFKELQSGEFLYRGMKQKFIAKIGYDNTFIQLFIISPQKDNRLLSANKGKYFRKRIKDCCSFGSVEMAIKKFDIDYDNIKFFIGGASI